MARHDHKPDRCRCSRNISLLCCSDLTQSLKYQEVIQQWQHLSQLQQ